MGPTKVLTKSLLIVIKTQLIFESFDYEVIIDFDFHPITYY